jgi:hypothetical protein
MPEIGLIHQTKREFATTEEVADFDEDELGRDDAALVGRGDGLGPVVKSVLRAEDGHIEKRVGEEDLHFFGCPYR